MWFTAQLVVLDWWYHQNFFCISVYLVRFFWLASLNFHPASCSQKDRIELHLVQVHHCLICFWVSFFVLISGKSDWLNDFCDLFFMKETHQLNFLIALHLVGRKACSQNDWFENSGVVESATGMSFLYRFLELVKTKLSKLFQDFSLALLDYHHPASCSQKDRIELHLVQVHHCLVCSFGCRFLF